MRGDLVILFLVIPVALHLFSSGLLSFFSEKKDKKKGKVDFFEKLLFGVYEKTGCLAVFCILLIITINLVRLM